MRSSNYIRYSNAQGPDIKEAATRISILVQRDAEGVVQVHCIEIATGQTVNRFHYSGDNQLEQVLNAPIIHEIEKIVELSGDETHTVAAPNYRCSLPGLTLARLRVVNTNLGNGSRRIKIRFGECLGNMASIFAQTHGSWCVGGQQMDICAS